MSERIKYEKSSANVFVDLGVSYPHVHVLRVSLAVKLIELMGKLELTQTEAARRLGIKQPEISRLKGCHLAHFSLECLLGFFNGLNQNVEIWISPSKGRKVSTTVLT